MRPSQKTKEERKWVVDTINKYFDVIVEEEEEEEENDNVEEDSYSEEADDEIESLGDMDYSDSEEDYKETDSEPEEEENDNDGEGRFKSTAKIRGLLSTAMAKISSSKSDLTDLVSVPDQKQNLLTNLKQKLGSQISLKRLSQDHLNCT